ncbi:U2 small nuclear ribonucleoprotein auxiliary factor 35 kDa subunit-related protein 1 [Denticeps clupeoides]|uniref:U2 small nuclear ribonucleoprotein auxiliary factor 35 kDa subunit-related protein 1 n=1 Tax=Denticeps clupeoides TaxID=299321 RepID=UPI0010A42EC6|nr:U2 small nuclear ribonucleoprotein auxiliary factor 35 kDa subunit-related protein 2 [Denticeps clupeoides]
MAASLSVKPAPVLSQKQRRAVLKKERRKRKRQALAKLRASEQEDGQDAGDALDGEDEENDGTAELERQRLHQAWLEREKIAQEEFQLKREREETAKRKKEEEEKRIKEEWEAQQRKEQEAREQKQQEKRDREEAAQKMLDQVESQLENGGPWRNPEAPARVDFGTEKDRANCPFFLKTGACRFGDRCSRKHDHPASSGTLMIRGMFVNFGMEQSRRDDYDTDASLEYSEDEVYQQFLEFYDDVLPEFKSVGKVLQFKVSCNFEPHLRGNVYVQYSTEEESREAFMMFNGRWYAGRQLQCEFSPVTRWKTAICGLFDRKKCPKGKHCNFLHVFRNPGGEFSKADLDLHLSPDRECNFTGWRSDRRDRSWSQRTFSPERSRRHRGEWRSRSRSREYSWRRRASVQGERSRRSRSRERLQSRSRDRKSRELSPRRCRLKSPVRGKDSSKKRSERSESHSPKKKRKDELPDITSTPHHHKSSKKSKKKKKGKKKHKRKRSKSPSESSSAESVRESGNEGDMKAPEVSVVLSETCEAELQAATEKEEDNS